MTHTVPVGSLDRLLETLDLRRPALAAHSRRVALHARQMGAITGLPSDELATIVQAALVHEAGALVGAGARAATDLPGFEIWCGLSEDVADVLWYSTRRFEHHRHAPLGARLLAVAHAFDELTTPREYHVPLSHESARMAIARQAGRRYCPVAVNALMGCVVEGRAPGTETFVTAGPAPDAPVAGVALESAPRFTVNYRLVTTS